MFASNGFSKGTLFNDTSIIVPLSASENDFLKIRVKRLNYCICEEAVLEMPSETRVYHSALSLTGVLLEGISAVFETT